MWRTTFPHWVLTMLVAGSVVALVGRSILWASSSHIQIHQEPPFFSPNRLSITLGTPLQWENRTHEPHSIVSDDCRSLTTCSFDSGLIRPDGRYTLPRLGPGRYPYHCGIHPFMRGFLTINPPRSFSSDI